MSRNPLSPVLDLLQNARRQNNPLLAVLADPDKISARQLSDWALRSSEGGIDLLMVGSSILEKDKLDSCVHTLKKTTSLPIVLFPGNVYQIHPDADALLFLSLLSGRNAELLIGQHVAAAHMLKDSQMEIIGTGYLLIDGGQMTAATYMSQTMPIPAEKPEIAAMTALAGAMLGFSLIYLDAGSGASSPVPPAMIERVRNSIDVPLIVGGGIRTEQQFKQAVAAGADLVVVGTAVEEGIWPGNWKASVIGDN